jgi:AcrR family transcriptional regulator
MERKGDCRSAQGEGFEGAEALPRRWREARLAPLLAAAFRGGQRRLSGIRPRPRGDRAWVGSSQRVRLLLALIEASQRHRYREVTVDELCRLAGVSTRALYERFPAGKRDCFLAAFDLVVGVGVERVRAAGGERGSWHQRTERIIATFTEQVAAEPEAARVALVESFTAGPQAWARIGRVRAFLEAFVARQMEDRKSNLRPPKLVAKAIVAGFGHLARAAVLAGRERELAQRNSELTSWVASYRSPQAALVCVPGAMPIERGLVARFAERSRLTELECDGERGPLLAGAARLAVRQGAETLTLERIAAEAGCSRWTAARAFGSAQEAVLSAIARAVERELGDLGRAIAAAPDWQEALCRATELMVARVAADPDYARLAYVVVMELGEVGMRLRDRLLAEATAAFGRAVPRELRVDRTTVEAVAGAIWGLIFQAAARGETRALLQYTGGFAFLALAPVVGPEQAARFIRSRGRPQGSRAEPALD